MKNNKGQALKPNFFSENLVKQNKVVEKSEATDEEKHLYSLSSHAGWLALKEHIATQIGILEDLNKQAISSGMSFEQIGYNSVVLNGVKEIVEAVFNKVNDAVEAVENGNK